MKQYKKFYIVIAAVLVTAALVAGTALWLFPPAVETYSKVGSSGNEVRQIQSALKKQGYYSGKVDGIYGSNTERAVRKFQAAKGLAVDGICGSATLAALGIGKTSTVLRKGSSGDGVKQVQTRLANWGYYSGKVDGIFGTNTENAVRKFQRNNGLTADGICGIKTLSAMGLSNLANNAHTVSATNQNVYLLARIISAEARGETYRGQVAVGAVVMNRVRSSKFPNTLAGVIYQKGAFTAVDDGQFDQPIADSAYRAAREVLAGADPTGGCLYYYNPATATSQWIYSLPVKMTIGKHRFSMGKN